MDIWEKFYKSKLEDNWTKVPYDDVVRLFKNSAVKEYNKTHTEKQKLLELGFGSGINLLHGAIQGYDVYGIDISEDAINYAKNLFQKNNMHASFYNASTDNMPFEDNFFDVIMESGLLVCLDKNQYLNTISEIQRILKKDGLCYVSCYGESDMRILNACPKINDDFMVKYNYKNSELYINKYSVNDVLNIFKKDFELVDLEKNIRIKYNLNDTSQITTFETILWRLLFKKR